MNCTTTADLKAMCLGEFIGTFLLVLFGTASVAVAVLFNAYAGLLQVAAVWGIGVTLAIYATRHLSCAHLNPAVSLGMVLAGRMNPRLLPWYWCAQLVGGVAAGATLLLLFGGAIAEFEHVHGIVRGAPESVQTGMMFGEYFPNPGFAASGLGVTLGTAMLAEGIGTLLLVTMIFALTEGCNVGRPDDGAAPVFIGATVAAIIAIIAPLTQAGLNPARDFGPRLVAYLAGWGGTAIPGPHGGFFLVYVVAPLVGGAVSALCFRYGLAPLMRGRGSAADPSGEACACDAPTVSRHMRATGDIRLSRQDGVTSSTPNETSGGWATLTARALDGESVSMTRIAGKPAILYFWATWCPQCKIQREVLGSLSREWRDEVQLVALSVDDDVPSVSLYLKTHTPLARELQATPELLKQFSVEGLPTLVVIDGKGAVRNVSSGLIDATELRRIVAPLRS